MDKIKFILNNQEVEYEGKATERLLDVLRDHYNLTSVKCGCKEGECGVCSVILDGKLVNSCLVAIGSCEGSSILTLEEFRNNKRFNVIEKAYGSVSAVQCGFCIPGMVLATDALLSENPDPTEEEIRQGISGNICRCTGYNAIVQAIKIAAKEGKGLW